MYLRAVLCAAKVKARIVVQEHSVAEKLRNQLFDLHTCAQSMTLATSVRKGKAQTSESDVILSKCVFPTDWKRRSAISKCPFLNDTRNRAGGGCVLCHAYVALLPWQ